MRSEFLSGWKDIANHLGKGVRTVQRYERNLGLPIRRPAGKGSVIAVKTDLDTWVASPRSAKHSQVPVASVSSIRVPLKDQITKMHETVKRMKKMRTEILASRERLRDLIRQIHDGVESRRRAK